MLTTRRRSWRLTGSLPWIEWLVKTNSPLHLLWGAKKSRRREVGHDDLKAKRLRYGTECGNKVIELITRHQFAFTEHPPDHHEMLPDKGFFGGVVRQQKNRIRRLMRDCTIPLRCEE